MMRIVKKSNSFSQKKRGYKTIKSKNKFYSLLSQIDAIEKNLKRLKYALKMYSVGESNSLHESIDLIKRYLNEHGGEIKGANEAREILEAVDKIARENEDKYAELHSQIDIKKVHRRYSGKKQDGTAETHAELTSLLQLGPEKIRKVVEEVIEGRMRYNKIRRRNYDSSIDSSEKADVNLSGESTGIMQIAKDITNMRLKQVGKKLLPFFKGAKISLLISGACLVGGFIFSVATGIAVGPVLLFFAIISAIASLLIIVFKAIAANLEEEAEGIISNIVLLSYRMNRKGLYNKPEINKVANYIQYGIFVEEVSEEVKEKATVPTLKTLGSRVISLLEHYSGERKLE